MHSIDYGVLKSYIYSITLKSRKKKKMKTSIPKSILVGFFVFSRLSLALASESQLIKKLNQIESYIYQDPLNAKTELLHLLQKNQQAPDTDRAKIYLKLGTTLGMTNKLDSGIWAAKEAFRLSSDQGLEKAGSLKLLATLYRLQGDFSTAESMIKNSLELNDRLWKNSYMKAVTLQEYASLCLDQYNYLKATTLYLEALKITTTSEFIDPQGNYIANKIRVNLAEAYLASGNYPFAISEFTTALPKLNSSNDLEGLLRAGIQLADAYIHSGQNRSADSLLEKLVPIAIKIENEELRSYILLKQGASQASRGAFSKSIPYYRRSYELMIRNKSPFILECVNNYLLALSKVGNSEEAMNIISNEFVKTALVNSLPADRLAYKKVAIRFLHQKLSSIEIYNYYQEILQLVDIVNTKNQQRSATELQAKYQFEKQYESERMLLSENDMLRQKANYKRFQLIFIVAIATLFLIILALSMMRQRQRSKIQEKELAYQLDRAEWMEREKVFRDQMILQQKMILASNISDNDTLKMRLDELVKEKEENRRVAMLEQLDQLKDKKITMEFMMTQFAAAHPTFASKLLNTYPKLSQADIQFCTLFRMSLTTKEISALLNIEPRSIYAKKYRIVEKMGLTEGSDFEQLIFGIG